jgi:exopolysaccharide biosynthesis WecB/TagA/CpsF family protein
MDDRRRAPRSVVLGGQRIDLIQRPQLDGAVDAALAGDRAPLLLASANLDHVNRFEPGTKLFDTTDTGQWLVLLDGMPLVWACKRATGRAWDKLAGSDLVPELLSLAETRGASVGFLGGAPSSREPLATAITERWPLLRVSGHWTPTREVIDEPMLSAHVALEVRAAGTDILILALSKGPQERWMARHFEATGARVCGGFGAATDFIAGTQKRAPKVFSRIGAEWLYRLARQPRRMARRYLVEGPRALALVARDVRGATA